MGASKHKMGQAAMGDKPTAERGSTTRGRRSASTESRDEITSLLASIVESSDDAIIRCDLDGTIVSWNSGAERIFGYRPEEMLGHRTADLGTENAREDPDQILERVSRGERVHHYETLRRHKDGSDVIVSLSATPIRNSAGRIIGASKVARDITSTRRSEEALRNADKLALTGRMAASIAHEINNPLEAITNLLYLLQQEKLSEDGRHYLELAQSELVRVSHIARQTLGFFRGAPGYTQCQISEIVESAIDLHAGRLAVSKVQVETRFMQVEALLCRQGELRQVLVNLIGNALDSIDGEGKVVLSIRPATLVEGRKGVRVTVADTGSGMSESVRRKIFEPFFTTKGASGTGLGLWVSQQIVQRHGGRITVCSRQSEHRHGTIFSITLPYDRVEEAAAAQQI